MTAFVQSLLMAAIMNYVTGLFNDPELPSRSGPADPFEFSLINQTQINHSFIEHEKIV